MWENGHDGKNIRESQEEMRRLAERIFSERHEYADKFNREKYAEYLVKSTGFYFMTYAEFRKAMGLKAAGEK